jgi:hypothetical protein
VISIGATVLVLAILGGGLLLYLNLRAISVEGDITVTPASGCVVSPGFDDIKSGAQVVIKDDSGKVIATTTLGPGDAIGAGCTFPFSVDVPRGSDFYGVELGRRGSVQYTADQLADGIHLTIGG